MKQQGALLHFPKACVGTPFVSEIVRKYDVEVNILQATITQAEAGRMFALFCGEQQAVEEALQFLRDQQIRVVLSPRHLLWDEEKCVDCGGCVGQCFSGALSLDPVSHRLQIDHEKCRACELCVPACSYGAIESLGKSINGGVAA